MRLHFFPLIIAALIAAAPAAQAQSEPTTTAGNFYFENTPWPLPGDGTSALKLSGMTSAHAVMLAFTSYPGGKPMMDSPVMTLLPGSIVKWSAPQGGCIYDIELMNSNPPVINMRKSSWMPCNATPATHALFRILATP